MPNLVAIQVVNADSIPVIEVVWFTHKSDKFTGMGNAVVVTDANDLIFSRAQKSLRCDEKDHYVRVEDRRYSSDVGMGARSSWASFRAPVNFLMSTNLFSEGSKKTYIRDIVPPLLGIR